jgi:hypothetical protein
LRRHQTSPLRESHYRNSPFPSHRKPRLRELDRFTDTRQHLFLPALTRASAYPVRQKPTFETKPSHRKPGERAHSGTTAVCRHKRFLAGRTNKRIRESPHTEYALTAQIQDRTNNLLAIPFKPERQLDNTRDQHTAARSAPPSGCTQGASISSDPANNDGNHLRRIKDSD